MMKGRLLIAILLLIVSANSQTAGDTSVRVPILPESRELELALSAAPAHLRDKAGAFILTAHGFKLERRSENGFTCIVNRDHPQALKPTCFDAEGTATIIPKIVFFGGQLLAGKPVAEIRAEIQAKFQRGEFQSPRRPGVAYMLSGDILNVQASGQQLTFPPHVMFYAPNLKNEDIGSTGDGGSGLPFIGYQGPHGYMIMVPPQKDSKSTPDEEAAAISNNCSPANYRALDFWIGEWDVYSGTDVAGKNRISRVQNGCALLEEWNGGGGTGQSMTFYDPFLKKWRQTWVSSSGSISEFTGDVTDGRLVLRGESHAPNGRRILRTMEVYREGEKVRQISTMSKDDGKTWNSFYDFSYVRSGSKSASSQSGLNKDGQ